MSQLIDAVPQGFHLYAYDDCGVEGRQPHVDMTDSYVWTFQTSDTDADLKDRSAVFSYKEVTANYADLDPKLDYVLAVTYASDHVYKRVQSLEADGVELHAPYAIPNAKAVRLIVRVPRSVTDDGKMALRWKIHGEVNATVSGIELWASAPPKVTMRLGGIQGLESSLRGRILDLMFNGVASASVCVCRAGGGPGLSTLTAADGTFTFERKAIEGLGGDDLALSAEKDGGEISSPLNVKGLFFDPVRYRPIPVSVAGLRSNQVSLDGEWRINVSPGSDVLKSELTSREWGKFRVPGQWLQQGYDVPQDKPVAVAREFTVPKSWGGRRVFIRFDAIHAGTDYWVNGKKLGYSENLFTPVEWEITDIAKPGEKSRIDLNMLVNTRSEALSIMSSYAFHNLGGIDRSVRLYALPTVCIRDMHVSTDLDKDYKDADLNVKLTIENSGSAEKDLSLELAVLDAKGKRVGQAKTAEITSVSDMAVHVPNPLKWTAETPNLYKMALELKQGSSVLERVERNIGFRKIEIKDRQMYVNGKRVKLAGACHHEIDPLTGRADTMRHAEEDVRLMKGANLNYIRTSHYPPCQELLDAADRIGMYVEVEAPFCWAPQTDELTDVKEVFTPTSAMVDYCHSHPSVIVWSLANESPFNKVFSESNAMVHKLDPTRPTTFNHPFANEAESRVTDIANLHYPGYPYDNLWPEDKRPMFLGEYFFPVCHEQTDVMIDPGLRELWGAGHAEPDTEYAKQAAADLALPPLKPGLMPGGWSNMYHSNRVIGGAIWASHDDAFYFPGGKTAGYAWHHGFWGLIDVWRRPKPEWWLSKLIFSPVWFPDRTADFEPGQSSVRVPVENRYSFTNLGDLKFDWEMGKKRGNVKTEVEPGQTGEIVLPIPDGAKEGDNIILRVTDKSGMLINALAIHLGSEVQKPLPKPRLGPPKVRAEDERVVVSGEGFSIVIDRKTGDISSLDKDHSASVIRFPSPHVTRYDFGDLNGPKSPPYAVFPDEKTRRIDSVSVKESARALEITIEDRYKDFKGWRKWEIDKNGVGVISCDYEYTGEEMNTREQGMRVLLDSACDEVKWRRWSEWDVYPDDFIGRTEGITKDHRDASWGKAAWNKKPTWPWSLDETEMGTADFRSVKFNVYEASLTAADGSGLRVYANADAHVRPALTTDGVMMHVLSQCRMGQVVLKPGDHLKCEFVVELVHPGR